MVTRRAVFALIGAAPALSLVAALPATARAATAMAPAPTATFTDPRGLFALRHPERWYVAPRPANDPDNVLTLLADDVAVFVKTYRTRAPFEDDLAFYRDIATRQQPRTDVTFGPVETVEIGGVQGRTQTTTFRPQGDAAAPPLVETAWIVDSNGLRFYFQCTNMDRRSDDIRAVIASITFAPPATFTDARRSVAVTYPRAWSATRNYADTGNVVVLRNDGLLLSVNVFPTPATLGESFVAFEEATRRVNPGKVYTFAPPEGGVRVGGELATALRYEYREDSSGRAGAGALWIVDRGGLRFWFQGEDLREYGSDITAVLDAVRFLV